MAFSAQRAQEAKAREHEKASAESLQVNAFKLKFKPDYFQAATHMLEAAQCFAAARMETESRAAYIKSGDLRLKDQDHSSAARAYELGGSYDKAAECYMICGSLDQAVRSLLRKASSSEDAAVQLDCYEKAIDVYSKDDSKDVLSSDVYKQYITKLLQTGNLDKYLEVSQKYVEVLSRIEQWPFVHKEILGQVIVNLARNQIVGAERLLSGQNLNIQGFVHSAEFAAGDDLISAFREHDEDGIKRIIAKPCVTYLNTEIVRIARSIKVVSLPGISEGGKEDLSHAEAVEELLL
jgi:tetratricopeptide (TPR) repeat protein